MCDSEDGPSGQGILLSRHHWNIAKQTLFLLLHCRCCYWFSLVTTHDLTKHVLCVCDVFSFQHLCFFRNCYFGYSSNVFISADSSISSQNSIFQQNFLFFAKIFISADFLFLRKFSPLIFVFFILFISADIFRQNINFRIFSQDFLFQQIFCANFLFQKIFDIFVAIFLVSADFLFFANRFCSADFFHFSRFYIFFANPFFSRFFSFEQIFLFLSHFFSRFFYFFRKSVFQQIKVWRKK